MIGNAAGVKQYVQMTAASVAGVAADDGRLLWRFARSGRITVPSVTLKDDLVFATSGYNVGCHLIKVTRDGDKFHADQVYASPNMTNHHGGVVLVGDHLYGYSDKGGWVCSGVQDRQGSMVREPQARQGEPHLCRWNAVPVRSEGRHLRSY